MFRLFTHVVSILLLFCLCSSQTLQPKPIPTWEKQETGRLIRRYSLTIGQDPDEYFFMVDTIKQKAYTKITSVTTGAVIGEHWLIWIPAGAPDGSDASKGYVYFMVQDPNPGDNNTMAFCTYKTGNKIHFGSGLYYPPETFPDHWDRQDVINIQPWVEIPDDLHYQGVASDRGVDYDVWASYSLCSETDFGTLPCNKITTLKDTNVPARVFLAQEASGQFRNSWWLDDEFVYYKQSVGNILPPDNWWTTCYNSRNGFTLDPFGHGFVSTPEGSDSFTLTLSGIPIDELGPVIVNFMFDGETCVDCIAFEDANGNPLDSITFTSANWQVPVVVSLRYLADGETYFFVVGSGGGYEIPHYQSLFTESGAKTVSHGHRILTCTGGVAGFGCN